jgi:hypothetical protein
MALHGARDATAARHLPVGAESFEERQHGDRVRAGRSLAGGEGEDGEDRRRLRRARRAVSATARSRAGG